MSRYRENNPDRMLNFWMMVLCFIVAFVWIAIVYGIVDNKQEESQQVTPVDSTQAEIEFIDIWGKYPLDSEEDL